MKKKTIFKSTTAIILTLCIAFSMITVATASAYAWATDKIYDKLLDFGLRGACIASEQIQKSVDNDDTKETISIVTQWCFMSAEETATQKYCEEILGELDNLKENLSKSSGLTQEMLGKDNIETSAKNLDDEWDKAVYSALTPTSVTNGSYQYDFSDLIYDESSAQADGYMDYFDYMQIMDNAKSDEERTQATKELEKSIMHSLYTNGYNENNYNAKLYEMYTDGKVNTLFNNTIRDMINHLTSSAVGTSSHSNTVAQTAVQFAYVAFPFSHQQYEFVTDTIKDQVMSIIQLEMIYNEFLSMQGEYLNSIASTDSTAKALLENSGDYEAWQSSYIRNNNDLITKTNKLLNSEFTASYGENNNKVSLSLNDYMRPEDAVSTTLSINGFRSNFSMYYGSNRGPEYTSYSQNITSSNIQCNKVMTHSSDGKMNVYYFMEPTSDMKLNTLDCKMDIDLWYDIHYPSCDYQNLIKTMSDGVNKFSCINAGNEAFIDNNAFKACGSTLNSYLSMYDNNIKRADYYLTPTHKINTNNSTETAYEDITFINSTQTQNEKGIIASSMSGEDFQKMNDLYSVILSNESDVYKQNAHLSADKQICDAKITSNNTVINNGESATVPSGEKLTITFKPQDGYTVKSIKCIRNHDIYNNSANSKTETVLFDEGNINMLSKNESTGYYTFDYTMPYSDATFVIESEIALDKIDSNSYIIKDYNDLSVMAKAINDEPQKYSNASFILENDIDCSGQAWVPVNSFNGTFDGNGHTISNLNIDSGLADGNRHGLFATLEKNATVKNLTVKNANVFSSNTPVEGSGVIAKVNNGKIEKCFVDSATVQLGNWANLGGIAGANNGTINNCGVVNSNLTRRWGGSSSSCNKSIGGISERNNGKITNCFTYNCNFTNGNSTTKGAIISSGNEPENCYYYTTSNVNSAYGISKNIEDFNSGVVAYLLNYGIADGSQVWFQNIDNGLTPDNYPVLTNNGKNTVEGTIISLYALEIDCFNRF